MSNLSSRGAQRRGSTRVSGCCSSHNIIRLVLAAVVVIGAATPKHASAQEDSGFVAWPRELASRAPALADAIAREFRQRPRMIAFGGRDTIQILFWNPKIWQDDIDSKVLPEKSMPIVREAARDVAVYVWTTFGRDAGVNVIRVAFVRVVHDNKYLPTHEVPAQEVSGLFSRQMLETAQLPALGTALREGGAWPPQYQKWLDSLRKARDTVQHPVTRDGFVRGPRELAPQGFALVDSIARDFGERPREIDFSRRDTIDVTFFNPSFWRNDMQSKDVPQASLPLVRKAAEQVGRTVWRTYGRGAGINVVRVTFIRVRRGTVAGTKRDVPVQEVTGQLTRKQLETGLPLVSMTLTQR